MGTAGREDDVREPTASDATGQRISDDAAVELEWQRLERQRLEEERDEAREDAVTAAAPRRRFPWPGLLAALAAGLIAAVAVNAWLASLRPQPAIEPGSQPAASGTKSTP